jgi:hypothetical protein
VVAGFDGGAITSDAGALLLGATDRVIGLVERFAQCFIDRWRSERVEHLVRTLVGQRVFGIALGYEGINDHDDLRMIRSWRCLPASLRRGGSIRRKLFKIEALVTISVRRIKHAVASGCPYKAVFATAHRALLADTS